jgi:transcription antitermination factor NusG
VILEYGDISKLKSLHWFMCELRSEKTIESTMKRVGKALHGIFRSEPIEIFIPVVRRDLDVFEMSTGPYIFVRSSSFACLLRLKQITGVVSLVTEGESNRPSKAIAVEDSYVQELIARAEEAHRKRAIGIEVGSFVRILNGETRDYCGVVEIVGDGRAVVRVTLRTKSILLETPVRNLLNISGVPANQRVYYYGPLVDSLVRDSPEAGLRLIEEDRHMDEGAQPTEAIEDRPTDEPKRHSRQRTVTALVKKLVLLEGQHSPLEIAKLVVASLKKKEIKAPKNLFIVYCIIKDRLMKDYFKKIDPHIRNYREVIKKFGREYKFSANQIAKLDSGLGIPVLTQEVCKDGRSREARQKSKKTEPRKAPQKSRKKESVKRKKLSTDKCGECRHDRKAHKVSPRGAWARCQDVSNRSIHNKTSCSCKRFKERTGKS